MAPPMKTAVTDRGERDASRSEWPQSRADGTGCHCLLAANEARGQAASRYTRATPWRKRTDIVWH